MYCGTTTIKVPHDVIDELYSHKQLPLYELPLVKLFPNQYVVVQNGTETGSALCRVKGDMLHMLHLKTLDTVTNVKPRNKEQYFAMDALHDDNMRVVTLTGTAGSGKTLLTLAVAVEKFQRKVFKKIILSKPTSQVGKRDLGILPGSVSEKIMPFMINYACNFDVIFNHRLDIEQIMSAYNIEVVPLQLIRGASFNDTLIIVDESQVLSAHEMLTLGTRVSEGSKLVLMGDLNQRDEPIAKTATGLFRFINDERTQRSNIAAQVQLVKSERGPVSELFTQVFEEV